MNILLVEDNDDDAFLFQKLISTSSQLGMNCIRCGSLREACDQVQSSSPDVALLDLGLPDSQGLDTLTNFQTACGDLPIVVLTGADDHERALELLNEGAQDYLVKGRATGDVLSKSLAYAVERQRLLVELRKANETLEVRVQERTQEILNTAHHLRESESRLNLALRSGDVGTWDWDIPNDSVDWDDYILPLFGASRELFDGTFEAVMDFIHPDDRARVEREVVEAIDTEADYDTEYRVIWPNGSVHYLAARGEVYRDANDKPERMIGVCWDITYKKEAELALESANANLSQQVARRTAQLLQASRTERLRANQMMQLATASRELIGASDLNASLRSAAHHARHIVPSHQSTVCIRRDGSRAQMLNAVDLSDKYENYRRGGASPSGEGMHRLVLECNKPIRATQTELESHPNCEVFATSSPSQVPLRGLLAIPLIAQDGVILGLLQLSDKEQGDFSAEDEAILTQFAQTVSLVIELHESHAQLERRVSERTAELNRSNKELEQFAYVASHDLKEPLRMVSSYSRLLAEEYEHLLDAEGQKYIGYATDGAKRMQQLIDDLLTYSRVGRAADLPEIVDMNVVADHVRDNLRTLIESHEATLVIQEPLPTVEANKTLMLQLLQNLIGNAIKFCGDEPPEVYVCCDEVEDNYIFSVRDNGIGINPQHQSRVFHVFQRLHSREKYEGTGIGLAVCKKIVEQCGGDIWLESEVDKGTTVNFRLPIGNTRDLHPSREAITA